jgi:phage shock protein C
VADRLYRSRDQRIIGGVAGGMAENLDLDPVIVRIGWVILALVAPITPLVYLVLMFVIPEARRLPGRRHRYLDERGAERHELGRDDRPKGRPGRAPRSPTSRPDHPRQR